MFARLLSGMSIVEGMTPEDERYFRDLYDHLIRISDLVDWYRDLLTGAMDTHLSTVSNRLNVVMKQLTIIATVFLPLSFLTGFFGQNFALLTGHVLTQTWSFWVLGIGLELVGGRRAPLPLPPARLAGRSRPSEARGSGEGMSREEGPHQVVGVDRVRPRGSAGVALDRLRRAHRRLVGVEAVLPPGLALAQQVPALVQVDLHVVEPAPLLLVHPPPLPARA